VHRLAISATPCHDDSMREIRRPPSLAAAALIAFGLLAVALILAS